MNRAHASTMFLVDDNADDIYLTWRQMRKEGIINEFVSEKNPKLAAKRLKEMLDHGCSVIVLLDISMPRVNGLSLLEEFKQDEELAAVPVIMYSASDDESDIFEAYERGADGYVQKPFRADEFNAAIANVGSIKTCFVQRNMSAANRRSEQPAKDDRRSAAHHHLTGV